MKRGLKGVRLVISDAREGLKQAISTVLTGTAWQRCRVHFMRNLLATVPHAAREAIAAIVRTIFAQPDHRRSFFRRSRHPPCPVAPPGHHGGKNRIPPRVLTISHQLIRW